MKINGMTPKEAWDARGELLMLIILLPFTPLNYLFEKSPKFYEKMYTFRHGASPDEMDQYWSDFHEWFFNGCVGSEPMHPKEKRRKK